MARRGLRLALRPRAESDIDTATEHYLVEAGVDVAVRFGEALTEALAPLCGNPGIGSARHADAAAMPGLRAWTLRPWPYTVFYVPAKDVIDVIRVLHEARDLPATLAEPPDAL